MLITGIKYGHICDRQLRLLRYIFIAWQDFAHSQVTREGIGRIIGTTQKNGDEIGSRRILRENAVEDSESNITV